MKRIYLLALAASLSCAGLSAQTVVTYGAGTPARTIITERDLPDFIVLHNGVRIKCRVISYIPGHPVKVLQADARVHVYRSEEVQRVETAVRTAKECPEGKGTVLGSNFEQAPRTAADTAKAETPAPRQAAQAPATLSEEVGGEAAAKQYDTDFVVLKSGRTLKCKVLDSDENGVQIQTPDGTIYYYRAVDVDRVERRPGAKAIEAARDVIVLKNGQKVQGTVLERSLDAPVKLRSVHGQIFTYKWDEVERILVDQQKKPLAPAEKPAKTHKLRLGFTAEVGVGYGMEQNKQLVGEMNPEISLTVGARLLRLLYVGVGATVQRYDRTEIMPVTPMLMARLDYPTHGEIVPFLDLRGGYSVNTISDKKNYPEMAAYGAVQLGVRFKKWTLGVGGAYHQVNKSLIPDAGRVAKDGSYGKRVIPAKGWSNQPEFTVRLGYQF